MKTRIQVAGRVRGFSALEWLDSICINAWTGYFIRALQHPLSSTGEGGRFCGNNARFRTMPLIQAVVKHEISCYAALSASTFTLPKMSGASSVMCIATLQFIDEINTLPEKAKQPVYR
jgi:hypothetical protein